MIVFLTIVFSLFVLVKSAEIFVDQASSLAKKLHVGDFLIGFTIVAFGTSLPELMSTLFSAFAGHNQLVVSNIIGSNIANLCLVFGIVALFNNYRLKKRDANINIPINMAALLFFWILSAYMGFTLNWASGISLILTFFALIILSKNYNHLSGEQKEYVTYKPLYLIFSLALLIISGKICIDRIIDLASLLKISESILGYFLLAIGTSLPELVTTWIAVKKNEGELGVGNILGSNLFNLLFIFGVSTFITPIELDGFKYDLVFLSGAILITFIFAITGKKYSFSKKEGFWLLCVYLLFIGLQISKNFI
ncbi:MAG: calcium/sodium antiporter [Candidatus Shapirobacteria bacterium]